MAAIFTRCPVTEQMIATGIETDKISLALSAIFVAKVFCPHCKVDHEWSKRSAWLEDGAGNLTRLK